MRRALITGGARGLGAAVAARLRSDGVEVITLDVIGDVDEIVDITDPVAVAALADRVGDVDVVINSAGIVGPNIPLLDTEPADWRRTFEVNVQGTVAMMQAFVPGMVERGWGRVVNFASTAGKDGNLNLSVYSATKAAVIALTDDAEVRGAEVSPPRLSQGSISPPNRSSMPRC